MSNTFCTTCTSILSLQSLLLNDFDPSGCQLLRSTSHDFVENAQSGCNLCLLFLSVFGGRKLAEMRHRNFEDRSLPNEQKQETVFTLYSYGSSHVLLEVSLQNQGERKPRRHPKVVLRPSNSSVLFISPDSLNLKHPVFSSPTSPDIILAEEDQNHQGPGSHTGCDNALALARRWLIECKAHPACAQEDVSTFATPTRLLYVGSSMSPYIRLCTNIADGTPYVSLSHSWGKHVPLKLLRSNLIGFEYQILISELPKTFREAIDVVRRLDIEYIWIDSLCIIQDSKEDWAHEAALMHRVYTNAVLNIAADDAIDSTEGLFRDRSPEIYKPLEVNVAWTERHQGTYFVVDNELWQRSMKTSVLNTRAWVLQESLLSRRILHFGRFQLFWECNTGKACEVHPTGLYEGHPGFGPKFTIQKVEQLGPFISEGLGDTCDERVVVVFSQKHEAHRQWKEIVDNYTARQLTFGSDKLVAISACARRFQEANLESKYLAGLWRKDIAFQLLWSISSLQLNSKSPTRQTEYRAPTWSWASIDGQILPGIIDLYENNTSVHIKIHEAETNLASNDPFGAIRGGKIIISGRIARVSLSVVVNEAESTPSYNLQICSGASPLLPQGHNYSGPALAIKDCLYENGSIALDKYDDIYFVPVIDRDDDGRLPPTRGRDGLLLQREDVLGGIYRRFGRYNYFPRDVPLFEQGFDYFDSLAVSSGLEYYEGEVSHRKMYIITII